MANKDLFKQAIAEAKSVREAAIANAKEALEETLTPHLKDMLAAKLQEMDAKSEEVEEVVNEVEEEVDEAMHKDKKDEAMHSKKKDEAKHKDDEKMEEATTEEVDEAKHDDDDKMEETAIEEEEVTEEVPAVEEAEDDSEESEDEAEEADGDEDLKDLSVDQFKDMIRDIIAQEIGHSDAPADDMDAGDIEGMGDEPAAEEPEMAADEEEIDLDELIRELEDVAEGDKEEKEMEEEVTEETSNQVNAESDGADYNINRVADLKEDVKEDNSELDQALETIETLKKELNEVNILNSKLLYVNKIFKSTNLSESQKVNVIAAFDKAETVKEVKLVYETVSDNVGTKKETTIKEHKGSASKATGTTAKKPEIIAEVSDAVRRMQKLAGII